MSIKSVPPLTLTFKPSRRLAWAVGICYGLAGLASIANAWPWWWRVLLLTLLVADALRTRRRTWLAPNATQLRVSETGEWKLWTADGAALPVTLLASSVVISWFMLLHFRDEHQRFHALALMPDSFAGDGFRQLTVRLRILGKFAFHKDG